MIESLVVACIVFVAYAAVGTLAHRIIDGAKQVSILGEDLLDVLPPPRARARFNGQSRGPSCVPAASGLRGKTRSFAKQRDRLIGRRS